MVDLNSGLFWGIPIDLVLRVGIEINLVFVRGGEVVFVLSAGRNRLGFHVGQSKLTCFVCVVWIDLVLVWRSKLTRFQCGDRSWLAVYVVDRNWIDFNVGNELLVVRAWDQNWLDFGAGVEIDLAVERETDSGFVSCESGIIFGFRVWIERVMITVWGQELACFVCSRRKLLVSSVFVDWFGLSSAGRKRLFVFLSWHRKWVLFSECSALFSHEVCNPALIPGKNICKNQSLC